MSARSRGGDINRAAAHVVTARSRGYDTRHPSRQLVTATRLRRRALDLEQRLGVPLGLERRAATAEAEQPLGPQDVDHGEHVERERRDPRAR